MSWIAVAVAVGLVILSVGFIGRRALGPAKSYSVPKPWRPSPFKVGKAYRVLQTFQAMRDAFTAGEIVVYRSQGYSRYDGVTGYFFEAPNDPRTRAWDVRDEEDLGAWKSMFEELPAEPVVADGSTRRR